MGQSWYSLSAPSWHSIITVYFYVNEMTEQLQPLWDTVGRKEANTLISALLLLVSALFILAHLHSRGGRSSVLNFSLKKLAEDFWKVFYSPPLMGTHGGGNTSSFPFFLPRLWILDMILSVKETTLGLWDRGKRNDRVGVPNFTEVLNQHQQPPTSRLLTVWPQLHDIMFRLYSTWQVAMWEARLFCLSLMKTSGSHIKEYGSTRGRNTIKKLFLSLR